MLYISFDIGIKNLGFCILNELDNKVFIIDWRIITLSETKKYKNINELSETLYFELDNIIGQLEDLGFSKIDMVLIENQPSKINGIMKMIEMLIFSYFNLLKHWDNIIDNIILINPMYKLQNHSFIPSSKNIIINKKLDRREKYKFNKSDAIEVCKYYISNDESLLSFFNSHKKKDDLSDSCIQVLSYIRKNGNNIEKIYIADKNLL